MKMRDKITSELYERRKYMPAFIFRRERLRHFHSRDSLSLNMLSDRVTVDDRVVKGS